MSIDVGRDSAHLVPRHCLTRLGRSRRSRHRHKRSRHRSRYTLPRSHRQDRLYHLAIGQGVTGLVLESKPLLDPENLMILLLPCFQNRSNSRARP